MQSLDAAGPQGPSLPMLSPQTRFDTAAQLVLDHLAEHVPMALWSVTRVENGRQTFLQVVGDGTYDVAAGRSHPWEDSFCVRMASGQAPAVAPDVQSLPVYASAPVNDPAVIGAFGAYGGAVIAEGDGSVFGAICGLDPHLQSKQGALAAAGPLLSLLGQLLSMVVAAERMRDESDATALRATLAAEIDPLTELFNRRAWERACVEEEARFRRLADPTVVVVLDLDGLKQVNDTQGHAAGDRYLQQAARALRESVKATDVVARLGGDEFGVLLRGCSEATAASVAVRMDDALTQAGVAGSIGRAPLTVGSGLPVALAAADAAMYRAKAARRGR